jgi:hypothetical protein
MLVLGPKRPQDSHHPWPDYPPPSQHLEQPFLHSYPPSQAHPESPRFWRWSLFIVRFSRERVPRCRIGDNSSTKTTFSSPMIWLWSLGVFYLRIAYFLSGGNIVKRFPFQASKKGDLLPFQPTRFTILVSVFWRQAW